MGDTQCHSARSLAVISNYHCLGIYILCVVIFLSLLSFSAKMTVFPRALGGGRGPAREGHGRRGGARGVAGA
jgi:hypothetical protein